MLPWSRGGSREDRALVPWPWMLLGAELGSEAQGADTAVSISGHKAAVRGRRWGTSEGIVHRSRDRPRRDSEEGREAVRGKQGPVTQQKVPPPALGLPRGLLGPVAPLQQVAPLTPSAPLFPWARLALQFSDSKSPI